METYLREWRTFENWSRDEAALVCGVTPDTVQRWEDHPELFPLRSARRLAQAWHWPTVEKFFTAPDRSRIVNATQQLVKGWATHMSGQISPVYLQYLHEYLESSDERPALSIETVLWAMAEADRRGRRQWRYLDAILSRLATEDHNGGGSHVFPDRQSDVTDPFQLARQLTQS